LSASISLSIFFSLPTTCPSLVIGGNLGAIATGFHAAPAPAMIFGDVEAFDWNGQQHITPRYTVEEIRALNAPLYEHIAKLEAEVARLQQL
jgi:hypothetical protein